MKKQKRRDVITLRRAHYDNLVEQRDTFEAFAHCLSALNKALIAVGKMRRGSSR